jgi:hypothetical protein
MSHAKIVLQHLSTGAGITSAYAFNSLGISRISAVIYKLKKEGHEIERRDLPVITRQGRNAWVGCWFMPKLPITKKQTELDL